MQLKIKIMRYRNNPSIRTPWACSGSPECPQACSDHPECLQGCRVHPECPWACSDNAEYPQAFSGHPEWPWTCSGHIHTSLYGDWIQLWSGIPKQPLGFSRTGAVLLPFFLNLSSLPFQLLLLEPSSGKDKAKKLSLCHFKVYFAIHVIQNVRIRKV